MPRLLAKAGEPTDPSPRPSLTMGAFDGDRLRRLGIPVLAFAALVLGLRLGTSVFFQRSPHVDRKSIPSPVAVLPVPSASALESFTPKLGVAPVRSGGGYECPAPALIAAYGVPLGFHSFPPHHPRHPDPSIAPDRCYRTLADADADGFTLGLPPQGWDEVAGLLLAPDWALGIDTYRPCQRAANALGISVPCLYSFPAPGEASGLPRCGTGFPTNPRCITSLGSAGAFFSQYRSFPGINGLPVSGQGLTLAGVRVKDVEPGSALQSVFLCGEADPAEAIELTFPATYQHTTYPAEFIDCTEGIPPSGGQLILRWNREGTVHAMGLPNDLPGAREILLRLTQSIFFAEPTHGR
jgi:hypothetical protein